MRFRFAETEDVMQVCVFSATRNFAWATIMTEMQKHVER